MTDIETLKKICGQRDRLERALADLVDKFWSAHNNHSFDSEDNTEKGYVCKAKRGLLNALCGCDLFGTDKCVDYTCPMGFHHRRMYESVRESEKVLSEMPAELIPFDLRRIPSYNVNFEYSVTPQWFARMLLMLVTSVKVGEKTTKEQAIACDKAIMNLIAFGLSSFGVVTPISEIFEVIEAGKDIDKVLADEDYSPTCRKHLMSFAKSVNNISNNYTLDEDGNGDHDTFTAILESIRKDDKKAIVYFMGRASLVFSDYRMDRRYPSGDLDVYESVFSGIKRLCIAYLGLETNTLAIAMNENDEGLDHCGITTTRFIPDTITEGVKGDS